MQISLKHGWLFAKHEDAHQQRDACKDDKPDLSLPGTGLVVRFSSSFIPPDTDILTMILGKKGVKNIKNPSKLAFFTPKTPILLLAQKLL